jgi:hypothetical protein
LPLLPLAIYSLYHLLFCHVFVSPYYFIIYWYYFILMICYYCHYYWYFILLSCWYFRYCFVLSIFIIVIITFMPIISCFAASSSIEYLRFAAITGFNSYSFSFSPFHFRLRHYFHFLFRSR